MILFLRLLKGTDLVVVFILIHDFFHFKPKEDGLQRTVGDGLNASGLAAVELY